MVVHFFHERIALWCTGTEEEIQNRNVRQNGHHLVITRAGLVVTFLKFIATLCIAFTKGLHCSVSVAKRRHKIEMS